MVGTTLGGSDLSSSATSGAAIAVQASGFTLAQTYYLTVTNAGGQATANVSGTPTTVSVATISPANPTVTYGNSQTFSSSASGGLTSGLTWSASAGTMNTSTGAWVADMSLPAAVWAVSSYTGTANTEMGTGAANGVAASATFDRPLGVAVDASGNVYVADTSNNLIRMIAPSGAVTTFAGGGGPAGYGQGYVDGQGTAAAFAYPVGLALDASGNVYVADFANARIRMITPAGVVSTYAGGGGYGATDGPALSASFNYPGGVAVDASGNVYVADTGNNKIRMITPGTPGSGVGGIVSSYTGTAGTPMGSGATDGAAASATFYQPNGLAVDTAGNVYVADTSNYKIRMVTPAGVVSTYAGTGATGAADGAALSASFYGPSGCVVDSSGNVYVADTFNSMIRMITPSGAVTTLAGSGGSNDGLACLDGQGSAAMFNGPSSLALDFSGNFYVADTDNNKVRKLSSVVAIPTTTITATSTDDPTKTATTTATVAFATPVATSLEASNPWPNPGDPITLTPHYSGGTAAIGYLSPFGVTCPATGVASAAITANWGVGIARTYVLTVTNAAGVSATASVTVTIVAAPVASSLTATAATITTGGSTTLTPAFSNGTGTITYTGPAAGTLASSAPSGTGISTGALTTGTYTFTLTVTNAGSATATTTCTVTVVAAPTAGITISNATPPYGATNITVTPTFTGGTAVVGTTPGGSDISSSATSGTPIAVHASGFTTPSTYYLTVTNAASPVATATANVSGAPTAVSVGVISPAAPTMTVNGSTTFSSSVSGAANTGITWSATAGSMNAATGAFTAPASAGSATIKATSQADGTKTASTTVTVVAAPAISTFVRAAAIITAGSSTTLTGTFSGGTGVVDNGIGAITTAIAKTVTPASTTTYTLTVTNAATVPAAAATTAQATITVVAAPTAGITISNATPLSGATNITVTPTFTGGTAVVGTSPGASDISLSATSGTPIAVQASGFTLAETYYLTVTNAAATQVTASVSGNPTTVSVAAISPANPTVTDNASQTFTSSATSGFTNGLTWSASAGSFSGNVWTADMALPAATVMVSSYTGTANTQMGQGATDGPAASAEFKLPSNVAVDAFGNVYVSDTGHAKICMITPAGVVSTYAGNGTYGYQDGAAADAMFEGPGALALDASGNLYVASDNVIRMITPGSPGSGVGGTVSTYAGTGAYGATNGAATSATFLGIDGLAVDASDNVFVADYGNYSIRMIMPGTPGSGVGGMVSTYAGTGSSGVTGDGGPATSATFGNPYCVAVDASGNVYVGDVGNGKIRMITPGTPGSGVGGTVSSYTGMANTAGSSGLINGPASSVNFAAQGMAFDASGNLYVLEYTRDCVLMITPGTPGSGVGGTVSTYAGTGDNGVTDGPAVSASFLHPEGMAVDASGNVYVADSWNNKIRKISPVVSVPATTITATSTDDPTKTAATTATVALAPPVATSLEVSNPWPNLCDTITLTPNYSGGTAVISYLPPFGVTCPATGVASAPITVDWDDSTRTYALTVTNAAGVSVTTSVAIVLSVITTNQ
jgi:sugar lactone lactonase YvrE